MRSGRLDSGAFEERPRGSREMTELNKKRRWAWSLLIVIMASVTFLPAWTFDYWQAWILLAVFFACTLAIDLYL